MTKVAGELGARGCGVLAIGRAGCDDASRIACEASTRGIVVLRTVSDAPTEWESVLPAELLESPAELDKVDRLLDDEQFVESYRRSFHATLGLASIPIRRYLG